MRGGWKGPVLTNEQHVAKWKSRCKIDDNGCWLWQRFVDRSTGYGMTGFRGKNFRIHRAMYIVAKGPIPPGGNVLHSCDVRHCCNPDHLRIGTISDNKQDELQRGRNWEASKTHCPRGHAYDEFGVRHGANQWRKCKICQRARNRIRIGWPEDLAYSVDLIPRGFRTEHAGLQKRRGGS